jgi:hypothetical protein
MKNNYYCSTVQPKINERNQKNYKKFKIKLNIFNFYKEKYDV